MRARAPWPIGRRLTAAPRARRRGSGLESSEFARARAGAARKSASRPIWRLDDAAGRSSRARPCRRGLVGQGRLARPYRQHQGRGPDGWRGDGLAKAAARPGCTDDASATACSPGSDAGAGRGLLDESDRAATVRVRHADRRGPCCSRPGARRKARVCCNLHRQPRDNESRGIRRCSPSPAPRSSTAAETENRADWGRVRGRLHPRS